jgi:TolB-like protein
MSTRPSAWILLIGLFFPLVAAAETLSIAVLDFASKGGITQEQMDSLSDMVAVQIRRLGDYRVIGKADIYALLSLEEQKRTMGCTDNVCVAEIGGALGVEQMVTGNVSVFGDTYLLNIKLFNVRESNVIRAISRRVSGDEADLLEEIPDVVTELFGMKVDAALVDRFEVEVHTHLGESLMSDATANDVWWDRNGYGSLGTWDSEWLNLNDEGTARGIGTGRSWGMGGVFGLRFAMYHLAFIQLDYLKEHWRGKVETVVAEQTIPWKLDVDFSLLRLLAGYRFAYPLVKWLAPFAVFSLGANIYLPQKVRLTGEGYDAGELELSPGVRFSILLSAGVRFKFAQRFFVSLSYQFDLPIGHVTTSGPMAGAGAHF